MPEKKLLKEEIENRKQKKEVLQKEIDWIKLSMDADMHGHSGAYNTLLQNIASMLILFLGILGIINLLIINYLTFLDTLHFILINLCLIFIFIMKIKKYEVVEKNKAGGITSIENEYKNKKCLVKKRYKDMGIDIDKVQKEFKEGC